MSFVIQMWRGLLLQFRLIAIDLRKNDMDILDDMGVSKLSKVFFFFKVNSLNFFSI